MSAFFIAWIQMESRARKWSTQRTIRWFLICFVSRRAFVCAIKVRERWTNVYSKNYNLVLLQHHLCAFFSRSNRFYYYYSHFFLRGFIALLNRVNCNLYTLVEPTTFIDTRFGLMEFAYFNFDVFKHLFRDMACWRTTILYWVDKNIKPVDFRTTFIPEFGAFFTHCTQRGIVYINFIKYLKWWNISIFFRLKSTIHNIMFIGGERWIFQSEYLFTDRHYFVIGILCFFDLCQSSLRRPSLYFKDKIHCSSLPPRWEVQIN